VIPRLRKRKVSVNLGRAARRERYLKRLSVPSQAHGCFEAPVEVTGAGLGCEVRDDEVMMLWSKLCLLAPFALATTASGESLGIVRSDPRWWGRLRACVEEACAVGVAEGAEVASEPIVAMFEGCPKFSGARCHRGAYPAWRRGARDRCLRAPVFREPDRGARVPAQGPLGGPTS
jgi:ketopantoate reductase